jgi:excisionase family DNA binding protein
MFYWDFSFSIFIGFNACSPFFNHIFVPNLYRALIGDNVALIMSYCILFVLKSDNMGFSQLKIPKICEHCGKPFEAKTVITRFCGSTCANKAGKAQKKKAQEEERKQQLLKETTVSIATMQTRPYISITEATVLFGISKNTIHRLIKAGKIPAINWGERLTRVSRTHIETMFTAVVMPEEKPQEQKPIKLQYEPSECYTINEISEKYGVSLSTVSNTIRRNSIPKRQVGKYVYVPKEQIDQIFASR